MKKAFLILLSVIILAGCDKEENRNSGGNNNGGGTLSSCSGGQTTVTDIDGNVYTVVSIGNQCWMKENLKTSRYRDGNIVQPALTNAQWQSTTYGAWSYYNNSSSYNNPFGKLYNWYAVVDSKGLCPTGWHVPTDDDWNQLVTYLDPLADTSVYSNAQSMIAGGLLKSTGDLQSGTGLWQSPNTGATNASNFTGLPGGFRDSTGADYLFIDYDGYWWSSTAVNSNDAWARNLRSNGSVILRYFTSARRGLSVRCVKD